MLLSVTDLGEVASQFLRGGMDSRNACQQASQIGKVFLFSLGITAYSLLRKPLSHSEY